MTLEFIDNSINKKLRNNENIIVYTFFELRVKENLSEEQVERFIELIKIKLINHKVMHVYLNKILIDYFLLT